MHTINTSRLYHKKTTKELKMNEREIEIIRTTIQLFEDIQMDGVVTPEVMTEILGNNILTKDEIDSIINTINNG